MNALELNAVQDYLYCSMLYYWRTQDAEAVSAGRLVSDTTLSLPGMVIASALKAWASGDYAGRSFPQLAQDVWRYWFDHYSIAADVVVMLERYAEERNRILAQFLSGKIRRPQGKVYIEPRLTNRYRDMLDRAGLTPIPAMLEKELRGALGVPAGQLPKLGDYAVADAYSDSLVMAARYEPPHPAAILGVDQDLTIQVAGIDLQVRIDLLIEGDQQLIAEVHDRQPAFYFDRRRVGRDLRLIAAAQARFGEDAKAIGLVRYRHLQSAGELERKAVRLSRLSFALESAIRGIQSSYFVPAFLGGDLHRCQRCPAQAACLGESEDVFEHYAPGTHAWGAEVMQAAEQLGLPHSTDALRVVEVLAARHVEPRALLRYAANTPSRNANER